MSFTNKAEVPSPTHIHDFSVIVFNWFAYSFLEIVSLSSSNSLIFSLWYFLDAVHKVLFVNSEFNDNIFLGHLLPGFPFSIKLVRSISLVFPLRLLKGTFNGEIPLKYKSFSLALLSCLKVLLSTLVTSGTNKNGVPQPMESNLYFSNKNCCSSAVPIPPCAVIFILNFLFGIVYSLFFKALINNSLVESINSSLLFLNSSKIGPIKNPSVAKA